MDVSLYLLKESADYCYKFARKQLTICDDHGGGDSDKEKEKD